MKPSSLDPLEKGSQHWWHQRLTAAFLVFLGIWFIFKIILLDHTYEILIQWLKNPLNAFLITLFLSALFYHLYLGIQIILEDYIHQTFLKKLGSFFLKGFCMFFFGLGLFSIFLIFYHLP